MRDWERIILRHMLLDLQEQYACASCNDFNLAKLFPDREFRHDVMKLIDPDNYDPNNDYVIVSDGTLLRWIQQVL